MKHRTAFVVATGFASLLAAPGADAQSITVPTVYTITPYLTGLKPTESPTFPDHLPTLTYSAQPSTALCTPVGTVTVQCMIDINLRTLNITAAPTASGVVDMMVGGLPSLDSGVGAGTAISGWAGNFEGIQYETGGSISMDATSDDNNTLGSRWFIVASYPDSLPVNCEWTKDTNVALTNPLSPYPNGPCWESDAYGSGSIPWRMRGTLWMITSLTAFNAWLVTNEANGTVTQDDP